MDDLETSAEAAADGTDRPVADAARPEPAPDDVEQPAGRAGKKRSFLREIPFLVGMAVVFALLLRFFLVQTFYIPSSSMANTLLPGDRVLVNKAVYHIRDIHRGEIIVFSGEDSFDGASDSDEPASDPRFAWAGVVTSFNGDGSRDYIKRVIGVPGDRVACCDSRGRLTVNDVPLDESAYLFPGDVPSRSEFETVVPEGRLWVMGDHRSVSQDSRAHLGGPGGGTVPIDKVVGKAFVVIWPIAHWRTLDVPDTFKQPEIEENASR